MKKLLVTLKNNYQLVILFFVAIFLFGVNVRMNIFSYNNFDFGKFDLGNMSQMLWNTLHGRFMYLTDYFGANLPRWAMSHVDPILLLFLPIFAIFPHALTLVFAQVFILLFTAFVVYFIALIELRSKFVSLLIALAYLSYPALGYVTSKTGFHGVSAAVPFFFLMFYTFERMYYSGNMSKYNKWLFWVSFLITLSGKEQISLYLFLYGIFLLLFRIPQAIPTIERKPFKTTAIAVSIIGIVWFYISFFVIIPAYAPLRVAGYQKFAESLNISGMDVRNVGLENYFLSRYDAFGTSYTEVIKNIILNPNLAVSVFFGGQKPLNFNMTFMPLLYLPFISPQILFMAVPDLMMNYLTTAVGVGTAEISNHRISMIIPILFISTIFSLSWINENLRKLPKKLSKIQPVLFYVLPVCLLIANIYTSFAYQNPVFMWIQGALDKRLPVFTVSAKTDTTLAQDQALKIGDSQRLSALENKDRECAQKIVNIIPDNVSVSGPDYLGAHLANRETYAIFPGLYNQADYVIVDVFSKKILTILNIDLTLINDVVNNIIKDPNYKLEAGCGNLFVFKKIGPHDKTTLLPIQERFKYPEKFNYVIYKGISVVDYSIPSEFVRGQTSDVNFVYQKTENFDNTFLFTSFVNVKTGDIYQAANLPSFAILTPQDWRKGYYYSENLEIVLPSYLKPGDYRAFVGMTNYIRTRSIYLGDVKVK